jgi:hypothetical protein
MMGNPLKRRAVRAMLQRWKRDEQRLADLFGEDNPEFSDEAEIQRNLGSAIAYAAGLLNHLSPQDVT